MATSSKLKIQWPSSSPISQEEKQKESENDLSNWNPMLDDYTSPTFNRYHEGTPGSFLPSVNATEPSMEDGAKGWLKQSQNFRESFSKQNGGSSLKTTYDHTKNISLYVSGIPVGLSEEGFTNLFESVGKVKRTNLIRKDTVNSNTCFGFVEYGTVKEVDAAIQKFDQYEMGRGIKMRVRISESKEDRDKRLNKKKEEESFLSTLSSTKHTLSKRGSNDSDDSPTNSNVVVVNNKPLGVNEVKGKPTSLSMNKVHKQSSTTPTENSKPLWGEIVQPSKKGFTPPSSVMLSPPQFFSTANDPQPSLHSVGQDKLSGQSNVVAGMQTCAYCRQPGKKRCAACKTYYCSRECQAHDWPSHKLNCKSSSGKSAQPDLRLKEDGIADDFQVSVPTDPEQLNQVLGLKSPPFLHGACNGHLQSTELNNHPSKTNATPFGIADGGNAVTSTHVTSEAELPPLPPETPPDSLEKLPSIKSFTHLPSSFPVLVLRGSAPNSFYVQVQCQEVQTASKECQRMFNSQDVQFKEELHLAKNKGCIIKGSDGQYKVGKVRAYKKDNVSVFTNEAAYEIVTRGSVFVLPPSLKCLVDSLFKFTLHDVVPFEGTDRDSGIHHLESLIAGKMLTCAVVSQSEIKYVRLTDPSSGDVINELMAASDYAVLLSSMTMWTDVSSFKMRFSASDVPQHCPITGKQIEILPLVVINPNMIWAQEKHSHIQNFMQLTADMNAFFLQRKTSSSYWPTVGELCAVMANQCWHRAEVLSTNTNGTAVLQFVDSGVKQTVSSANLRGLEDHKFLTLPRQAFLVSLSGVHPVDPSGIWDGKVVQFLNDRVLNRTVEAEVVYVRGSKFSVRMVDPSSVDGLTVNQLLVSEGFAKAKLGEASAENTTLPASTPTTPGTPSVVYYQSAEKSATIVQPQETSLSHSDLGDYARKISSDGSQTSLSQKVEPSELVTTGSFIEPRMEESLSQVSSRSSVVSQKQPQLSPPVVPSLETEWPAMVTHAIDPMNIWLIPQDKLEAFGIVLTSTEQYCSSPANEKFIPEVGAICLAPFDNHYYRSRIVSVFQGSVNVQFVDFGNNETVQLSKLIAITDKLCETPALAIHCKLDRITYSGSERVFSSQCKQFFKANVSDKQVIAQIHRIVEDRMAVSIQILTDSGNSDLSYEIVKQGYAAFISGAQNGMQTPSDIQTPADSPKPLVESDLSAYVLPESCQVGVTSVCSPSQFWVIEIADSLSKLDRLNTELNAFASSAAAMPLSAEYTRGCLCCALFDEDNTWYRAVILSSDGSNYTVRFLDYGNKCTVSAKNVRILASSFLSYPSQAVECSLFGIQPFNNDWSPESISFLKSNTQSVVLSAKTHGSTGNAVTLELFDSDGQSLSDKMVYTELAKFSSSSPSCTPTSELEISLGKQTQVSVMHVDTPLEFWVQTKGTEKQHILNSLMEKLQSFYSVKSNHSRVSPAVGALYCSKYDDGFYYRCRVLDLYPKNRMVKVLYIDFANFTVIEASLLLKLHDQFTAISPFAFKCSLSGFSPSNVNAAITKRFTDEAQGQIVNCSCVSVQDNVALVDLYTSDGCNMLDVISNGSQVIRIKPAVMPSSEVHVLVSTVSSPSSIFVQLVTAENHKKFSKMTEELQMFCSKASSFEPSVGTFCSALFKEDRSWYRAKVLSLSDSGAFVSYVDFGNQAIVPYKFLKPLPQESAGVPAFALEVSIAGVEPVEGPQWSTSCKKFLQSLMENKSFVMNPQPSSEGELNSVEFVDTEGDQTISEQLVSVGLAKAMNPKLVSNGHGDFNSYNSNDSTSSYSKTPLQCSDVSELPAEVHMVENMADVSLSVDNDSCEAIVLHAASLKELHVMAADHIDKLSETINLVQARAAIPAQFNRALVLGELCLAKFSEDNSWYRAEVVKLLDKDGLVLVRFIDFGNSETVSSSSLLPVSKNLFSLPLILFSCALYGIPYSSTNNPSLIKSLSNMTDSKKLLCKIVHRVPLIVDISDPLDPSGLTIVEQLCYSGSLHSISASDNIRVPLAMIPTDDYIVGTVTDIKGPQEFYMQILSKKIIPAFQKMCGKLEEYKQLPPAADPIYIGQLVCALSAAYDTCYRARVIGLPSNQQALVHYVDYGNQEIVSITQVWPMKHDLQLVPFMATRCCLKEYEKARSVEISVVQQFSSLVADRHLQVRKINAHPPYGSTVVELVDTNQSTDVIVHKALKATL